MIASNGRRSTWKPHPISIVNPHYRKMVRQKATTKDIAGWTEPEDYPVLQSLTTGYDYAIELTSINEITVKKINGMNLPT